MNVSVGNHRLVLFRHGETEWSRDRKHTGRTDIDLLDDGREQARRAANTLAHLGLNDPIVFSSPRRRALLTAELAGLAIDEVSPLLAEWDYGDYEGLTTDEIRTTAPGWLVWTHGCPGGESVDEVSARADRAVDLALEHMGERDVVFVSHGHFSRSVLTRWVEQPLSEGVRYGFGTASVAVCGFEYGVRQLSSLGLTTYRTPDIGT
ncbi:phoE Broad specificity phosphatase PhoE and related phosphatases [Mycobacteriaceae bacterium]